MTSFMTGRMESNDDAVARLEGWALPGSMPTWRSGALDCRRAAADPDALFPERTRLPSQVAALTQFVAESDAEHRNARRGGGERPGPCFGAHALQRRPRA